MENEVETETDVVKPGDIFKSQTGNVYLVVNPMAPSRRNGIGSLDGTFFDREHGDRLKAILILGDETECRGRTWDISSDASHHQWRVVEGYTFEPLAKVTSPKNFKYGVPFVTSINGGEVMVIAARGDEDGEDNSGLYMVDGKYICGINDGTVEELIRRGVFIHGFDLGEFKC